MPLDEEDKKFITELINTVTHKASTEREKRFEARVISILDERLEKVAADSEERFNGFLEELAVEEETVRGQGGAGGSGDIPDEYRARFAEMEKTAKEAAAKAAKWEADAKAAKEESLRAEEVSTLTGLLKDHVKGPLLDMVVKDLHRHVARDKANPKTMLWKKGEGDFLSLQEGVKEWTESDAGKEVRPARDVGGGGGRGPMGLPIGGGGPGGMTLETLGSILTGAGTRGG